MWQQSLLQVLCALSGHRWFWDKITTYLIQSDGSQTAIEPVWKICRLSHDIYIALIHVISLPYSAR